MFSPIHNFPLKESLISPEAGIKRKIGTSF